MPNWCENELSVTGREEDVYTFIKKAGGENGDLDFESFIPYPNIFSKIDEEAKAHNQDPEKVKLYGYKPNGYNSGGYEWCIENWDTKWNACDVVFDLIKDYEDEETAFYEFNTAWSPPISVIKKMGEMFPNLVFVLRYFECGVGYNGILEIKGGVVLKDETADYYGHRGG